MTIPDHRLTGADCGPTCLFLLRVTVDTRESVTFRLGLVVLRKRFIRTTIGTVFIHTLVLPPRLPPRCCHVMRPVMCRSCVVLRSSSFFHELLILVSLY
jgi:hypothetical protein